MNAFLYNFGYILNLSAILMLGALGNSFSIKAGDFNLGGEGQIYLGGFVCSILLNLFGKIHMPPIMAVFLGLISAFATGSLITLFSTVLKKTKNASFLLTSYILSTAIIQLIDGLITGIFRNTNGNLIATPFIEKSYRFIKFSSIFPVNYFFIFAILSAIACGFVFYRTNYGKRLKIFGISPQFASYAGLNENSISFSASAISGGMHGICGAAAVCGIYYTCHRGFYVGMGWNALAVAMLAKSNPYLIIPSSLFMSTLITCADRFALFNNYDFDISGIIQGLIIILISILLQNTRKNKIPADFCGSIKK